MTFQSARRAIDSESSEPKWITTPPSQENSMPPGLSPSVVDGGGEVEVGDRERIVDISDIDGSKLTCGFKKRCAVGIADCKTGGGRTFGVVEGATESVDSGSEAVVTLKTKSSSK